MALRKILLAVVVGASGGIGALGVASVAPASATVSPGTGTYSCSHMTGKVTFSPAWSDNGGGTVTAKMTFTATGCSGGNPTPTTVTAAGTIHFTNGNGSCNLGTSDATEATVLRYSPAAANSKLVGGLGIIDAGAKMSLGGRVRASYQSRLIGGEFLGTPKGNCSSGITSDALHQSSQALVDY
jgi:hypothetical protein